LPPQKRPVDHRGDLNVLDRNTGQVGYGDLLVIHSSQLRILYYGAKLADGSFGHQATLHGVETLAVVDALGDAVGDHDISLAQEGSFQFLFPVIVRTHGRNVRALPHLVCPNEGSSG
jgi:hypothetical protein